MFQEAIKSGRPSCPDTLRWNDLLEGRLAEAEQAALSLHLENCVSCQQALERLTADDAGCLEPWPRPAGTALGRAIENLVATSEDTQPTVHPATFAGLDLPFLQPALQPDLLGRLGNYEVLDVIGRGGMGVVLKALDPVLARTVAIKVLAPQWAATAGARQRFEREARATAAIRHENVVAIHSVDQIDGLPYLVMEYVSGMSLQQYLDSSGPLDLEEIVRIGQQTAAGLAAAHAEGLIHRDVKPGNVLVQDYSRCVKLSDFGLARAVDDATLTQSGVIAGTPQYMAPEQAAGLALDHRADLFSLGSVLYALCAGRPPFRAPTTLAVLRSVCDDTPTPLHELNPQIPVWFEEIIATLHAKNPADRIQSAAEVAELLGQHLGHLRAPDLVKQPPRLVRRPVARPRKLWLALAALIAVFVLVAMSIPLAFLAWRFLAAEELPENLNSIVQRVPANEPPVQLANARCTSVGARHTFKVDYRLTNGNLPPGARLVWIVRSPTNQVLEKQVTPQQASGTLEDTRIIPVLLLKEPLETFLEMDVAGQRQRASNSLPVVHGP
jgi:serine/threonine-protein kinase